MKNLLLSLLILNCCVFSLPLQAAQYTSSQTGNWSQSSTWGGAGVPGDGDNAIIDNGHVVTVTANATVGDGTNAGIEINGSSTESYGTLKVNDNVTLTVKGANTSTDPAILVNQYGHFEPQAGSTIVIDCSFDYQTCIVNNGYLISTGSSGNEITFTTASADRDWSNTVTDETISGNDLGIFEGSANIYVSFVDHRPISNAAGTGLGSHGDSSFCPDTGSCTPWGVMTTEKSSYDSLSSHGDYYVDYGHGIFYYVCTSAGTHSVQVDYKYLSYYGSGILSQANTNYSSATFDCTKFEYLGSDNATSEYLYGALMMRYKYSPAVDSDRQTWVKNCTFQYCYRPLTLYNSEGNNGNEIEIEKNTFNKCWRTTGGSYANRAGISLGWAKYIDINYNTFDVWGDIIASMRNNDHIYFDYNSGRGSNTGGGLYGYEIYHRHNNFTGYGKLKDATCILREGSSCGNNYWQDNTYIADNRVARVGSYMVIERNKFSRCYHHGFVTSNTHGYLHDSKIINNVLYDNEHTNATFGGGITTSYNKQQWVDNFIWANNTSDYGDRGIAFNDLENGSATLVTRSYIVNNIISNTSDGIYFPPKDSDDETALAPYQIDYNVDYNNGSQNATNVVQATFTKGGNEYNTDNTRNLKGFVLFDPDSSYSLPYATDTTLALTVSGTAGTDLSYDVVWGGGTAVDLVLEQGTATGGSTSTLVKNGAGWTTNEFRCDYVKIHSGTGAGQIGMIKSNTADTLNIIAQNDNDVWSTAPDNTSVFVIYDSMIKPADSSSRTVRLGIYLPDSNFPTSSTSDTGIHIEGNGQTGDPEYVDKANGNFHISSGSSAIANATDMSPYFTDDNDGATRSTWDIGAYLDGSIYPKDWRMISLPVDPTDKRLNKLFPDVVLAYGYEKEIGYVQVKPDENLEVGKGYWILLEEEKSYTLTGHPIPSYTRPVSSDGWAMIGGCTSLAQASSNNCNIRVIYRYVQGIGYQRVLASEYLEPGQGYWILLNNVDGGATITVEAVD